MLVYKENETLKQETRMLREKANFLEDEVRRLSGNVSNPTVKAL